MPDAETPDIPSDLPHIVAECRPKSVIAALYDALPFPNIGLMQEVAFDVGVTAYNATVSLTGIVFKGYSSHQTLFEQRWPARLIMQRTKEENLTIRPQTG